MYGPHKQLPLLSTAVQSQRSKWEDVIVWLPLSIPDGIKK